MYYKVSYVSNIFFSEIELNLGKLLGHLIYQKIHVSLRKPCFPVLESYLQSSIDAMSLVERDNVRQLLQPSLSVVFSLAIFSLAFLVSELWHSSCIIHNTFATKSVSGNSQQNLTVSQISLALHFCILFL